MLIFVINPGSTSTRIALIKAFRKDDNYKLTVEKKINISHSTTELASYKSLPEQLLYREQIITDYIRTEQIDISHIDAFVGRSGGLLPLPGGTYQITDLMADHALHGKNGIQHPANLGCVIAYRFGRHWGKPAFTVNPPDVDELQDLARITGIRGIERHIHLHTLNLKETAIRHAKMHKEEYQKENYIVCHIGGGISVSAHRKGRMIDGYDIAGGDGPMAPTRCGSLSVTDILRVLERDGTEQLKNYCVKNGGFVSHLGTSDAKEVYQRAENGDPYAQQIWNAMIYQIAKSIGAMASVLHGQVRAILLGGSMVYNQNLSARIRESCSYIAPVFEYPGEFEMEAMAAGVCRVMNGEEKILEYHG